MKNSFAPRAKYKKLKVFTDDEYLFRKIQLDAGDCIEVIRVDDFKFEQGDLILFDSDMGKAPQNVECVIMSRKGNAQISIPFPLGTIENLCVCKDESSSLSLDKETRCAILCGEQIKLTEVEFNLLSALVSRRGDFSSREELLKEVWGPETDGGVINVYIHYLREKLEKKGEKIILSSRKSGYRVDKKFLEVNENA